MRHTLFILMALLAVTAEAQAPETAINSVLELNSRAQAAQKRIDELYQQRQKLLNDINTIEQEGSAFAVRNRELDTTIAEVKQSLSEINADMQAVAETQIGIIELLREMIEALAQFIELDLPFDLEKRRAVITELRTNLSRSDISVTQKYQAVVSAYLNEVRLGHTNSVAQERIETPLGHRIVDVLRVGRAGLWYVTQNGAQAGRWDARMQRWVDTDTNARDVMAGVHVVREIRPPSTIALPVQIDIP